MAGVNNNLVHTCDTAETVVNQVKFLFLNRHISRKNDYFTIFYFLKLYSNFVYIFTKASF